MSDLADLPKRLQKLLEASDDALEAEIVAAPRRQMKTAGPPPGNARYDLPDHMILLQRQHEGRPLATLLHAALVVLIRREIMLNAALERYFALWEHHDSLLLRSLSLRWLVSAADTFADHGRSPAERSCAFSISLFVNTIKFYETERVLSLQLDPSEADLSRQAPQFDLDGISPFGVVKGDTAGNLFKRKDRVVADLGVTGKILAEVMRRSTELDTVYARFRKLHKSKRHGW